MTCIDEMLMELKDSDLDTQVKEVCDNIFIEEKDNFLHYDYVLKGPNIFLCLEVPGRTKKELAFVCLEREYSETYITSLWTIFEPNIGAKKDKEGNDIIPYRKTNTWPIKENKPGKILKEYAKIIKLMKGE